jgi:hypothetical protein
MNKHLREYRRKYTEMNNANTEIEAHIKKESVEQQSPAIE